MTKRLKEVQELMWGFADRLIDADHELFREGLSTVHEEIAHKPLEFLYERFSEYIADRRAEPRATS
jgi:hypothetical protein